MAGNRTTLTPAQREIARLKRTRLEDDFAGRLRQAGVPEPVREWCGIPGRKYRFDFAWPAARLVLEVEGLTNRGGRHQRIAGYTEDARKYNLAVLQGLRVLRVTAPMLRDWSAVEYVQRALGLPVDSARRSSSRNLRELTGKD